MENVYYDINNGDIFVHLQIQVYSEYIMDTHNLVYIGTI
jgi:hypothetical protein